MLDRSIYLSIYDHESEYRTLKMEFADGLIIGHSSPVMMMTMSVCIAPIAAVQGIPAASAVTSTSAHGFVLAEQKIIIMLNCIE